jgi:hypothetical protein
VIAALSACVDPQASREPAAPSEDPQPVTAEPPAPAASDVPQALIEALRGDLAARSGAAPEAIRVVRAQAMRWNDSSLGCPQPGQAYMQVIVDGYWVVLEAGGREYDYRSSLLGGFALCEHPPAIPGGRPREAS